MELTLRIKQRFGLSNSKLRLLAKLLLMGASVMALKVLGYSTANALFLSNAGPEKLPQSYIMMGLLSIPIYTGFSQIVDSRPRPQLFQHMLLLAVLLALVLRIMVSWNALPVYYTIFIVFYFQWTLLDILFNSLVSDYFTSLEYKRCVPLLAMAQGVGGLLGAGLTALLSGYLTTENMLLSVPVLDAVLIGQLVYLQRTEKPLKVTKPKAKTGLIAELKSFPALVKQTPIVFFISASTLLVMLIYSMAEFQYLSMYSRVFPDAQKLAAFLGQMWGVNNILQLAVLGLCTQPLLWRLGVTRMNLAYPMTTFISFLGLALNFGLPTAIFANINNDSLSKSINRPIHTLNYNAVPHDYVGRVRVLGDGLFYSIGVAVAGLFLWTCQGRLTQNQMTLIGIGLIGVFLVVRYKQGKSYVTSLLALLNSDSVKLSDVSVGLTKLPSNYSSQVRKLLNSSEVNAQINGLELAARLEEPRIVLWEVDRFLVADVDRTIIPAVVKFLTSSSHPNITRYLGSLLASDNYQLQLIALEALIASKQSVTNAEIRHLLRKTPFKAITQILESQRQPLIYVEINQKLKQTPLKAMASILEPEKQLLSAAEISSLVAAASEVQAVACVAASQAEIRDPEIVAACDRIWQSQLSNSTREVVIRSIHSSGNRALIPLLEKVLIDAPAEVKRSGLEALTELARPGDLGLAELAVAELGHADSLVRATALHLLGVVRSPTVLNQVAASLEHPNLAVRLQAAQALANYGTISLPLVQPLLYSPRQEVVEAAVAAVAKVGSRSSRKILYSYLKSDYRLVPRTLNWIEVLPDDDLRWQAFKIAIADYHARLIQRVMHVLASLDREGTLSYVREVLDSKDPVKRADALETLASMRNRRFVLPIIPLLERTDGEQERPINTSNGAIGVMLEEALESGDRWIQIVALLANTNQPVPEYLRAHQDALMQAAVAYLTTPLPDRQPQEDFFLYQVLFLKTIPLLESLSFDELLQVQEALKLQECAANEQICAAETPGSQLYIVYKGSFSLVEPDASGEAEPQQLIVGQHWGETGLFGDYPLPATMIADSDDCKLLTLPRENFQEIVNLCPRLLKCLF
ncbi:MAG: HEAT repeat domain-containing protein [Hormoscilla sp.]